jgi:hypothetical protein
VPAPHLRPGRRPSSNAAGIDGGIHAWRD